MTSYERLLAWASQAVSEATQERGYDSSKRLIGRKRIEVEDRALKLMQVWLGHDGVEGTMEWIRAHQLTRSGSEEVRLRPDDDYDVRTCGEDEPYDVVPAAFFKAEFCADQTCKDNMGEPLLRGKCIVNQTGTAFKDLTPAQQKLLLAVGDTGLKGYELSLPRGKTARVLRDEHQFIERIVDSHLVVLTDDGMDVLHSKWCEDCQTP